MDEMEQLTGYGDDLSGEWIAIADVYYEINLRYMDGTTRSDFDRFGEGVEAVAAATWAVLGRITKAATLKSDKLADVLGGLSVETMLSPMPNLDPNKPDKATGRTYNKYLSLSHGTIGSGDSDRLDNEFSRLVGRQVYVSKAQFQNSLDRVFECDRPTGRPSNREEVKRAYARIYPEGHEAVGDSWKIVLRKINEECGLDLSIDTIKRAIGLKK